MRVLGKYEEIFTEVPGKANIIEHKIDLTDDRPIRCKPYVSALRCSRRYSRRN